MNLASRHAFYQTAQEQVIHEAFTGDLYYLRGKQTIKRSNTHAFFSY
jgi:hypothetical protein